MFLLIIASECGCWNKMIGNNGRHFVLSVNPQSPQEIASAIDKLYKNKALAKHLGENGRKAVEGKYNFEAEMEGYLNFLLKMK